MTEKNGKSKVHYSFMCNVSPIGKMTALDNTHNTVLEIQQSYFLRIRS